MYLAEALSSFSLLRDSLRPLIRHRKPLSLILRWTLVPPVLSHFVRNYLVKWPGLECYVDIAVGVSLMNECYILSNLLKLVVLRGESP